MPIYLPIAEMSVNGLLLLGMGGAIGVLSGVFGIGGGFLMTPFLIFIGVPSPVAVASATNQIVASSVSGLTTHWRRGNVDLRMGGLLVAGGLTGSLIGVNLVSFLRSLGQIDVTIRFAYILLLGFIGSLMLIESVRSIFKRRRGVSMSRGPGRHSWMHGMPFKMRFRKSGLYISALLPFCLGIMMGILVAVMGISGIVMVPAMIYILGMPTQIVVGTNLFYVMCVTATTTFLQAVMNQSVDIALAFLLLLGSVIGAQIGARLGTKLKGEQLRVLLALLVLCVCGNLVFGLIATPEDFFSLEIVR